MKRKSPVQVQALEAFYFEQMYPTPKEMEDMGKSLGFTVKEVSGWFKRRRSRGKGMISPADDVVGAGNPQSYNTSRIRSSRCDFRAGVKKRSSVETRKANCQELFTSQHILAKIFRKDGPPLGSEFDHLSSGARKASWLGTSSVEQQKQIMTRKRKISELMDHTIQENATVMKHGIGKGLMTVWRVMNPNRRDVSPCVGLLDERATLPQSSACNPPHQKKKQRQLASILKQKLLQKRSTEKKRRCINREVELNKDETQREFKENCELALDREVFKETCQTTSILVDDEELEMRERQERGNPLTCSCHHSSSGSHGCFLYALIGAWRKSAHRLWAKRLRRSSTVSEMTQVIGDFVGAINEDWLWHSSDQGHSNALLGETISCYPSMPQTTSAMALWLVGEPLGGSCSSDLDIM
ncbi:PREDICTED: homeobox-DDT domain protein RLT3-like [Camelina sativa]|uniref:Homeobox-DDT domain protein RLT3-like n=1 Tax=Camelina sativa TaxID=90675 RepID=A0ABM1QHR0_CAMSA|nr:PREDICTED: homeobox-DDT domain protein RLT3-like [Camelina sativa]